MIFILHFLAAWFLCHIGGGHHIWYEGIWHGIFFLPNFIMSIFSDVDFIAHNHSIGYIIWYWIMSISSTIGAIFGYPQK